MSELDDMIKAAHALADKELDKYKDKRREHFTTTMLVLLTGSVIWCLVTWQTTGDCVMLMTELIVGVVAAILLIVWFSSDWEE